MAAAQYQSCHLCTLAVGQLVEGKAPDGLVYHTENHQLFRTCGIKSQTDIIYRKGATAFLVEVDEHVPILRVGKAFESGTGAPGRD
ncbi:hypothetical protein BDB00DRAFT_878064 [Zychaea mexicana]|uniref:uncharacterized protein n=1 Tax=Zychaea mexicana TaxID=64656 RepID=UPI0022FDEE44|nr:uncharacterized protein BDB00DRAFT_878064 [Zychaea mexicana]KAI9485118.1 hypothetical protein BDB00DRAFT_878064 [Zychaea mexicana]